MNTVVKSDIILTPYYNEIIKDTNTPFWYTNVKKNYEPYQFFVLRTRLISAVPKSIQINIDSNQYEDKMRYNITLSNSNNILPLSKVEADVYQGIVNDILINYPSHCLFLYKEQVYKTSKYNKPLSNDWVTKILPYCYDKLIDKQYNPILYNDSIIININPKNTYNDLTINTDHVENYYYDYNDVHYKLQEHVINKLYEIYLQGGMVLNKDLNYEMIDNWHLIPLYNTYNSVQIYVPNWKNEIITGNYIYNFLDNCLNNNYLMLHVNIDLNYLKTNNYTHYVLYNKIYVKINNYNDLINIYNTVII